MVFAATNDLTSVHLIVGTHASSSTVSNALFVLDL